MTSPRYFQLHAGIAEWWEDTAKTATGYVHEPSGWEGTLQLASPGSGYANCTAARAYTAETLASGQNVISASHNKAWLNDNLCSDRLPRFVRLCHTCMPRIAASDATFVKTLKMASFASILLLLGACCWPQLIRPALCYCPPCPCCLYSKQPPARLHIALAVSCTSCEWLAVVLQVCEVDAGISVIDTKQAAPGQAGPVAGSPFFIPTISVTAHPAGDGSANVFRVMGVPATADSRFEHAGHSHLPTWFEAQQVSCSQPVKKRFRTFTAIASATVYSNGVRSYRL